MKNLKHYVERENQLATYFGRKEMTFPLDQESVSRIAGSLDSNMSPEILHCDGEISASDALKNARYYRAVMNELRAHALQYGATVPKTYCI